MPRPSVPVPDVVQFFQHAGVEPPLPQIAHVERTQFVNEPKILRVMMARFVHVCLFEAQFVSLVQNDVPP